MNGGVKPLVGGERHSIPRQLAHDFTEQLGGEHNFSRLADIGVDGGGDPEIEIEASQEQAASGGPQQDALEGGQGGFAGDGALHVADGVDECLLVTDDVHIRESFPLDDSYALIIKNQSL